MSFAFALTLAVHAAVDLAGQRLYYQVERPISVDVTAGESRELVLLASDNTEVARGAVPAGAAEVDVAQVIPGIHEHRTLHYLQLLVDGQPTGSALVFQPLVEAYRPVMRMTDRGPAVERWLEAPEEEAPLTGFRVYPEKHVVLHTTHGDITLVLRPDEAPNTAWNFLHLVEGGFYTHIPFHRVVVRDRQGNPFVIQAGDPSGTGSGGPGYSIDLEPTKLPHDLGVISMAREGHDVNTAGSQFFICLSREGTARLDVQYCSFGQTIDGIDVVQKIAAVPVGEADRPLDMPYITTAEAVPAPPRTPGRSPAWMQPVEAATPTAETQPDEVHR